MVRMFGKLTRSGLVPVMLLIAFSLAIGLLTIRDYGASWDELLIYKYADRSINAYSEWLRNGDIPFTGNTYDNFGPFYVTLVAMITRFFQWLNPGWLAADIRHLIYFITFQVSVYGFYLLCKRWLKEWAAFGATVLFSTQPLLWGHAFISPKDIPFMSFFMLSIVLGFRMVDAFLTPLKPARGVQENETSMDVVVRAWKETPGRHRTLVLAVTVIWLLSIITLFGGTSILNDVIGNLIREAVTGGKHTFIEMLITRIAADIHQAPVDLYIQRSVVLFLRLKIIYFLLSGAVVAWMYKSKFPSMLHLLHPSVIGPGVMLGMTTSIRILGPAAGLLVCVYALAKIGKRAIPVLLIYAGIAIFITYLTWPFLWPDPINRFIESFGVMSKYPWEGQVLFNSELYASNGLPVVYIPILLALQFTEPVWILFTVGLIIAAWVFLKNREKGDLLLLLVFWFVLPLLGLIVSHSPLYDNLRQIFFILPIVFVTCGLALEKIFEIIRRPVFKGLILAALVLPGIVQGIRLHPYEYVYYNSIIGGTHGAFRRFELDYWCISFREAANFLNHTAPANARVLVVGPAHTLEPFIRKDIKVFSESDDGNSSADYQYAVITTRYNWDLTNFPEAEQIFSIQRDGAVFSVIRQLSNIESQKSP